MDDLIFLNLDDMDDDHEKELLLQIIKSRLRNPCILFPWDFEPTHVVHQGVKPRVFYESSVKSVSRLQKKNQTVSKTKTDVALLEDPNAETCVQPCFLEYMLTSVPSTCGELLKSENAICDCTSSNTSSPNKCKLSVENNICFRGKAVSNSEVTGNLRKTPSIPLYTTDTNSIPFTKNSVATVSAVTSDIDYSDIEFCHKSTVYGKDSLDMELNSVEDSLINAEKEHCAKVISSNISTDEKVMKYPLNGNIPSCSELSGESLPNKWNKSSILDSFSSRTFADVVKNKLENISSNSIVSKTSTIAVSLKSNVQKNGTLYEMTWGKNSCIKDDKSAMKIGSYLFHSQMDFAPVRLQPRGLINRRNWCYINATLQALLACCPFYNFLRNLPVDPSTDRGKSSTPVTDCMVNFVYKFEKLPESQEPLQVSPFPPVAVYETLGILKSDCLKGQQEDAEEFLSYILNGMHEEMACLMKNYKAEKNPESDSEVLKSHDDIEGSDEDEWHVIGAKHKGLITRRVCELKTPISELLGGEIKSYLSTSKNRSAFVQPFFTLQLDIQSENVSSLEEALDQMATKEAIQGYTCARTKKEVEAYSQVTLQKLPPILILHLKRFLYNVNGGCKKVMKHTQYPLVLELKKDWFAPETRRCQKQLTYKLFAVVYHDGEEAVKGHYICDAYNHSHNGWIRFDDRSVTSITETEVISHSPPRVPYLLFYETCQRMNLHATEKGEMQQISLKE